MAQDTGSCEWGYHGPMLPFTLQTENIHEILMAVEYSRKDDSAWLYLYTGNWRRLVSGH